MLWVGWRRSEAAGVAATSPRCPTAHAVLYVVVVQVPSILRIECGIKGLLLKRPTEHSFEVRLVSLPVDLEETVVVGRTDR